MKIEDLRSFGPKSREMLAEIGITRVEQFMATDPYEVYALLKSNNPSVSLNAMYAIISARENIPWLEIARTRKTEILLRLDELGLAPD